MKLSQPGKAWCLFGIMLIVNTLQSIFTPLLNDEPYYWLYSKYLSWGYLDHPPMIAFLIRIGNTLLPGEIGVRFLSVICGSLTFLIMYKIIEGETDKPLNFKLVTMLMVSSIFLNLYSFMALPDTPMLFFGALFLYLYRKYINADNLFNIISLGIVMACLLYSKYHGVLLIGFTILSNLRIFKKWSFYSVLAIALFLFIPHLSWQIQNDYPTIRFQFFERANSLSLNYVFNYIGEQAAVTGPVIFLLFSILYKPENDFQKALKFNVIGIFSFFLLSSFKEMINVHWTAIAWPAMVCLTYLYITKLVRNKKWINSLLAINIILVIVFRINFVGNFFKVPNFNDKNPQLLTSVLKSKAKGYPLVFKDMYNEPSYFMFYGHQECFAVNNLWYKKTQFNYLPQLESDYQGKTVKLVTTDSLNESSEKISIPKGKVYYITVLPNLVTYNTTIKIIALNFPDIKASTLSIIPFYIENKLNNNERNLFIAKKAYLLLTLINNKSKQTYNYRYDKQLDPSTKTNLEFTFKAPVETGTYSCIFSIMTNGYLFGINSNIYTCTNR